jgi:acetyl-CoA synthetase
MIARVEGPQQASDSTIDALLKERRTFPPDAEFTAQANVRDDAIYGEAEADSEAFWAKQAERYLSFSRPWDTVLEWNLPFARWFVGGTLNASYQCLDRHVERGRGDKVAYLWEGEPGDTRSITYAELLEQVCRLANGLRSLGVKRGDRVGIYMGMVPELPVAMLACARIGAAHSVVFGGFSAEAVSDRMTDFGAVCLITQDEAWQRDSTVPLKTNSGGCAPDRQRRSHAGGARPLVPRSRRRPDGNLRAGGDGLRGPSLHAVHLGNDRQAEGHQAHHRRVPVVRHVHA